MPTYRCSRRQSLARLSPNLSFDILDGFCYRRHRFIGGCEASKNKSHLEEISPIVTTFYILWLITWEDLQYNLKIIS